MVLGRSNDRSLREFCADCMHVLHELHVLACPRTCPNFKPPNSLAFSCRAKSSRMRRLKYAPPPKFWWRFIVLRLCLSLLPVQRATCTNCSTGCGRHQATQSATGVGLFHAQTYKTLVIGFVPRKTQATAIATKIHVTVVSRCRFLKNLNFDTEGPIKLQDDFHFSCFC